VGTAASPSGGPTHRAADWHLFPLPLTRTVPQVRVRSGGR